MNVLVTRLDIIVQLDLHRYRSLLSQTILLARNAVQTIPKSNYNAPSSPLPGRAQLLERILSSSCRVAWMDILAFNVLLLGGVG